MDYHTPTQLGRTQSLTKEGFLLVRDVRIGRVGVQKYYPGEIKDPATGQPMRLSTASDGFIHVTRTADEVFAPMSVNSLNTATFTLSHPSEWVGPRNRAALDLGQVMNARRGKGADANFLVADILVKDEDMIGRIQRKEIRDVSAGYGAKYRDLGGGRVEQYSICHNHVAGLTIDRTGRCGPECAIQDHFPGSNDDEDAIVTTDADKPFAESVLSWIMGGGKPSAAPAPVAVTTDESPAIAALTAKVDALHGIVAKLVPMVTARTTDEGKKDEWGEDPDDKSDACEARRKKAKADKEGKTGDAAALGVKFATVKGSAEILAPGIRLPAAEAITLDHICACQKVALKAARANAKTADAVKAFGNADIETLDANTLDLIFAGAAELVRQANNRTLAAGASGATTNDNDFFKKRIPDQLEDMNRANREYWEKQRAGQV